MTLQHSMRHRHIDDQEYTLAAVDDVIGRGGPRDWLELREAVRRDADVAARVNRICAHYTDEDAIRYRFWAVYLQRSVYVRPHA